MRIIKGDKRLDILINNKDYIIRLVVAQQGYELDILVNDESNWTRMKVAEHGIKLIK